MKKLKTVRMGIVGVGSMGSAHARMILDGQVPGCRLAAVCDQNSAIAGDFADAQFFDNVNSMIMSGAIDAILIATPHYSHTPIGISALNAGLHVLVEKPISVHKADCEKLLAAPRKRNQVFGAMFNQRTDPRFRKLRELVQDGELGQIRRINWIITDWFRTEAYYSSGGWRATWKGEGGGVLLNQCPHNLDLWQWIFGMPKSVRAHCAIGRYHDIEVEDDVTAYLEYPNGTTGVFITSTGESPGTNRLEVTAEQGKVVIEGDRFEFTRNEVQTSHFSKTTTERFSRPPIWDVSIPISGRGPQHLGILQNFTDAILTNAPLIAPAADGIHSVELANAMLYSSFTGKAVELPLTSRAYERFLKKKIAESTHQKKVVVSKPGDDFSKSF